MSIISDKPQTTRTQIRGVLNRPDAQIVFVDTPGHPQAPHRCSASGSTPPPATPLGDVDVVCLVVDATAPIGPGDRFVAGQVPADAIIVVNKIDIASPDEVLAQLAKAADQLDRSSLLPGVGQDRRRRARRCSSSI